MSGFVDGTVGGGRVNLERENGLVGPLSSGHELAVSLGGHEHVGEHLHGARRGAVVHPQPGREIHPLAIIRGPKQLLVSGVARRVGRGGRAGGEAFPGKDRDDKTDNYEGQFLHEGIPPDSLSIATGCGNGIEQIKHYFRSDYWSETASFLGMPEASNNPGRVLRGGEFYSQVTAREKREYVFLAELRQRPLSRVPRHEHELAYVSLLLDGCYAETDCCGR